MSTHIETIANINNAVINGEKNISPSSNIPPPKKFIGREAELAALRKAKERGIRSFVLHGAGGVGKTDLALKFIEENKAEKQKAYQINMFGLSENALSAEEAMLEVIRMFDRTVPPDLSGQDIENLYNGFLNEYQPILFFDNAKDRAQVEPLNNPSAFILVTSRTHFTVTGGFSQLVEGMLPADARNLLYSIADEARYEGEADKLAYLAGYLPMALLPLGSLLAEGITIEAKDLVQKYSERKESLKEALKLADPNRKNLSVEASFDLSYDSLTDDLKECWRKLGVFPADFALEAMETVCGIENCKTTLEELLKKHLLEYNFKTKRLRLHDLARLYTKSKLSAEELYQFERHFCLYYGQLLAGIKDKITLPNLEKFDLERSNIEYGFNWLKDRVEEDNFFAETIRFYLSSPQLLSLRLHSFEFIKWLETSLKANRKIGDRQGEGNSLNNLGNVYQNLGDYQKSIDFYLQSLEIFKEIGDQQNEGGSLNNLGAVYQRLGDYQKAKEYFLQSLKIKKEIGDRLGEGRSLGNLGVVYESLGDYQKAIDYHLQSLEIAREIGNRLGKCESLNNLGNVYARLGEYQKAIDYHLQSLEISKELSDRQSEGRSLGNLGNVYGRLGEYQKSIDYQLQSLETFKELGDRLGQGRSLGNLGNVYESLGDYQKAIDYHLQSLEITREIGDRLGQGSSLGNLGNVYQRLGEYQKAKDLYREALGILEAIGSPNAEIVRRNLMKLEAPE